MSNIEKNICDQKWLDKNKTKLLNIFPARPIALNNHAAFGMIDALEELGIHLENEDDDDFETNGQVFLQFLTSMMWMDLIVYENHGGVVWVGKGMSEKQLNDKLDFLLQTPTMVVLMRKLRTGK